ncbi:MAG: Zn-ribbon domain-containing OB-fold protein [Acidimicrobiales bacterium]
MSIEALRETLPLRALPAPDNASRHYWQSAAEGRLVVQHCTSCGVYQFYPRALCATCAGETEWVDATGRGTLHTFTIIRQNRSEAFAALSPYAVGIVELEEGIRMMTNIVECDVEQLQVGMALEVLILKAADDVGLPFWRPVTD